MSGTDSDDVATTVAVQTPTGEQTVTVHDWQGAAFDPSALRVFSLLPDCDADEAYCVRHEREMEQINPVCHTDGALYTTADGWGVYSCRHCRREMGPRARQLFRARLALSFSIWDDTDEHGGVLKGAFTYLREGGPEDLPDPLDAGPDGRGDA